METKKTIYWIRLGVILTFFSLLSIVLVFEYSTINGWTNVFKVTELALIMLLVVSFFLSFIKTGLWKFTHKSLKKMDEREIALLSKSLRYGYAIFSVAVLGLLLFLALSTNKVSIVMAVSLILFAHLVPASIIGWTEKRF
ncbi:MAG: hypothetical protein HQ542_01250 [Bacteroidia bacterium]|nr:hypothetical protein [Bacteroidia bacterium]